MAFLVSQLRVSTPSSNLASTRAVLLPASTSPPRFTKATAMSELKLPVLTAIAFTTHDSVTVNGAVSCVLFVVGVVPSRV